MKLSIRIAQPFWQTQIVSAQCTQLIFEVYRQFPEGGKSAQHCMNFCLGGRAVYEVEIDAADLPEETAV